MSFTCIRIIAELQQVLINRGRLVSAMKIRHSHWQTELSPFSKGLYEVNKISLFSPYVSLKKKHYTCCMHHYMRPFQKHDIYYFQHTSTIDSRMLAQRASWEGLYVTISQIQFQSKICHWRNKSNPTFPFVVVYLHQHFCTSTGYFINLINNKSIVEPFGWPLLHKDMRY